MPSIALSLLCQARVSRRADTKPPPVHRAADGAPRIARALAVSECCVL